MRCQKGSVLEVDSLTMIASFGLTSFQHVEHGLGAQWGGDVGSGINR
jgi:hypothetical protein